MVYMQIVVVCSEVHENHRNTLNEQNVERFLVKSADI